MPKVQQQQQNLQRPQPQQKHKSQIIFTQILTEHFSSPLVQVLSPLGVFQLEYYQNILKYFSFKLKCCNLNIE